MSGTLIFRVGLHYTVNAKPCLNVFDYACYINGDLLSPVVTPEPASNIEDMAGTLAERFTVDIVGRGQVGNVMTDAFPTFVTFNRVVVKVRSSDVAEDVDLSVYEVTEAINETGHVSNMGEPMPNFVALGVRYQRPSAIHRHGYKRFGGIAEGFTTNGKTVTGAFEIKMNAVCDNLLDPIAYTGNGFNGEFMYVAVASQYKTQPLPFRDVKPFTSRSGLYITSQVSRKG